MLGNREVAEVTWKRIGALGLAVGATFGVVPSCSFESDFDYTEIYCEEAVAHLEKCCGSLDGVVRCVQEPAIYDREGGCGTPPVDPGETPELDAEQSSCLRSRSCEQLRAENTCEALGDEKKRQQLCREN